MSDLLKEKRHGRAPARPRSAPGTFRKPDAVLAVVLFVSAVVSVAIVATLVLMTSLPAFAMTLIIALTTGCAVLLVAVQIQRRARSRFKRLRSDLITANEPFFASIEDDIGRMFASNQSSR